MSRFIPALITVGLIGPGVRAHASFDELSDDRAPPHFELSRDGLRLVLKGEAELELHDIEGRGGAGFDSPTDTRTIGTRSPFVEIDSFWLALRLALSPNLGVHTILEFSPRGSSTRSVYFEARGEAWAVHRLELGFQTPFVAVDRRTERYPLIASAYWREPEVHAAYEARLVLSSSTAVEAGLSVAMMRPLSFAGVQESQSRGGTIRVLAYGPARVFSGNGPVFGARARLESHGAFVGTFGFVGALSTEAGTDVLRNDFATIDSTDLATTFWWAGGRAGIERGGLHLLVEGIASRESMIARHGAYGQVSYEARLTDGELFHTLEPLFRYEVYRIRDPTRPVSQFRSRAPSDAVTWDFDVSTFALMAMVYRHFVRLRLELYLIQEHNGAPALGVLDAPFRNNEFLAQVELRF